MSTIEVNKVKPQTGTDVQLGESGDTITVPSGATLDASNATTTLPANVVTTTGTQTLTNKSIASSQITGTITPSDDTVTGAKLNDDVISSQPELATEPADTDEFLVSDAGTIKRIDYSLIKSAVVSNQSAFRNIIINGDMTIAQRGTSQSSITSDGYYTVDRFLTELGGSSVWTQSQASDAPSGQGFTYSLKMDCTTAQPSPASNDIVLVGQSIEGFMLQPIKQGTANAESTTLSFWHKHTKTGTNIVELLDADNANAVSGSYTQSVSDTWEKATITFPANTSGTYDNDKNRSLRIRFIMSAGSDYTSGTLATTWQTSITDANRYAGQVNNADSTSNNFIITGVQYEVGTSASDFEFLPYDVNLQRCLRYFYAHASNGQVIGLMWWYQSGVNNTIIHLPIEMRTAPSASTTSGSGFYRVYSNGNITDFTSLSGLQDVSPTTVTIDSGITGSGSQVGRLRCNTNGKIEFSAEL